MVAKVQRGDAAVPVAVEAGKGLTGEELQGAAQDVCCGVGGGWVGDAVGVVGIVVSVRVVAVEEDAGHCCCVGAAFFRKECGCCFEVGECCRCWFKHE